MSAARFRALARIAPPRYGHRLRLLPLPGNTPPLPRYGLASLRAYARLSLRQSRSKLRRLPLLMTPTSPKLRRFPTYRMPHDHPIVLPLTPNIPFVLLASGDFSSSPSQSHRRRHAPSNRYCERIPSKNAARIAVGNSAAAGVLPTAIDGARRRMRANRLTAVST